MNNYLIEQLRECETDYNFGLIIGKAADALEVQDKRIAELEAALLVRLDREVLNDIWRNRAESAESAVKRLAKALEEAWREGYHDGIGDGHPLSSGGHRWRDSEAVEALDDPVVKRILEETP